MESESNFPPVRAIPKTSRGERRVTMILDAAADLIAEVGYDAVTTNAIALRAGTSIGSLYQFFPNKETLVQALAERYRGDLQTLLDDALLQATGPFRFAEQLELLIDSVVAFSVQNAAFETLFCFAPGSLQGIIAFEALGAEMLGRVLSVFALWGPDVPSAARQLYAEICMCTVRALLPNTHIGTRVHPEMVSELKRLVANYLTPVFGI